LSNNQKHKFMETSLHSSGKILPIHSKFLAVSAKSWFIVATIGQWLFGLYIVAFYHRSALVGDFEHWNKVLPKGYVVGDWKGNLMMATHVLLAGFMVIGGPLQFIPAIRNRFKTFHRWLGRTYVYLAVIISFGGFIMLLTRGSVGSVDMRIFNCFQAFYVFVFAFFTIQNAKKKRFAEHRKWALRLFLVANGVWFFRIGLMAWLLINQAPVGFDAETFSGPFLSALAFFSYALPLPLLVSEMYFYAQKTHNQRIVLFTASVLALLTLLMTVGIFGAVMGLWLPKL
jgi:Predicted membrane protein (DUF2306)